MSESLHIDLIAVPLGHIASKWLLVVLCDKSEIKLREALVRVTNDSRPWRSAAAIHRLHATQSIKICMEKRVTINS